MNILFITIGEFGAPQNLSFCYLGEDFYDISNSEARDLSFMDLRTPRKREQICSQSNHPFGGKKKIVVTSRSQIHRSF